MDVVVDTGLEVEAGWLPELLHVAALMVNVKNELGQVANKEQAQVVSLKSSVESLEVRAELCVALVSQDLNMTKG